MLLILEQITIEKKKEKEAMLNDIQELEYKLSILKNNHYELYGEIESLVHVIELLKHNKELKQKLNAIYGKRGN